MKYSKRFSHPTRQTTKATLIGCLRAIKTVIWTPPHENRIIHRDVNQALLHVAQPTNPSLAETLKQIRSILPAQFTVHAISAKERLGLFAALMQFTMYLPTIRPYFRADATDIAALHRRIAKQYRLSSRPVTIAEQFHIAAEMTNDPVEALWILLVTTRQYARWYDGEAIVGFRNDPAPTARRRMISWYKSVAALKQYDGIHSQDSAGDTYYVWTHVIAKLVFGPMSPWWAIDAYVYRAALHIGTWLNHNIAHKVSPQSTPSDHTIAARYGNAIGKCIAQVAKHHV